MVPSPITAPAPITITLSQVRSTKRRLCSTITTVTPLSRRPVIARPSSSASTGFTPASGSSSSTIFGAAMATRANSSSRFCPPLRLPAGSCATGVSFSRSSRPAARSSRRPSPPPQRAACEQRPPDGLLSLGRSGRDHVLGHGERWPLARHLEGADQALPARPVEAVTLDLLPVQADDPLIRLDQPGDQVDRGALARPVGPDEPGNAVRRHRERAALDRTHSAEAFPQVYDVEGGCHRWVGHHVSSRPTRRRGGRASSTIPRSATARSWSSVPAGGLPGGTAGPR